MQIVKSVKLVKNNESNISSTDPMTLVHRRLIRPMCARTFHGSLVAKMVGAANGPNPLVLVVSSTRQCSILKSQVITLQTAQSWADAGVWTNSF